MKKTEITLPPEWLDLGNINAAQVGDEVATLHIKNGKAVVTNLSTVRIVEDWRILTKAGGWQKKNLGAAPYFMGLGTFYYSVNPEHIRKAKRNIKSAQLRAARKEKKDKAKVGQLHSELSAILAKYGASLSICFGEGTDTHGICDEKIIATIGNQSIEIE